LTNVPLELFKSSIARTPLLQVNDVIQVGTIQLKVVF
jgi:hypothetical protein